MVNLLDTPKQSGTFKFLWYFIHGTFYHLLPFIVPICNFFIISPGIIYFKRL